MTLIKTIGKMSGRVRRFLSPPQNAKCPICRGQQLRVAGKSPLRNGVITPIYECESCRHKFRYPLPSRKEVQSWYQGMQYFGSNCVHQGLPSVEYSEKWTGFVDARVKVFDEYVKPCFPDDPALTVVEIGCLEGMALRELARRGHTAIGLESNAEVAERSRAANGVDIRVCDFETDKLDVRAHAVLAFHVFEHLHDPLVATAKAVRMLRPGGVLLLELPCDDDEFNNPEHFHFFNESSIHKMMASQFKDVTLIPNSYVRDGGTHNIGSFYAVGRNRRD
jgi:SAM-dependent methyltransferase